jgi:hypothetical protein
MRRRRESAMSCMTTSKSWGLSEDTYILEHPELTRTIQKNMKKRHLYSAKKQLKTDNLAGPCQSALTPAKVPFS